MAKVTIKLENEDGTILDFAEASMSDLALGYAIDAMATMRGFSEELGVSKARFFSWELRKYAEAQVDRYAVKVASEAAMEQAQQIKDSVIVP